MNLPAVGEIFAGKYAIEAVVGRGGMGVVLAARHVELDERVAIKLILAENGPTSADFIARFVREAKLASKIKNEHVVRVIDVARLETGEPYIAMELLEGQDLAELLTQRGPLPVDLAAKYVLQACEAIAEAHALGIVHRDLKPANLFLCVRPGGQPCIKVLDFGISKLVGAQAGQAMTQTNAILGSPYYMSPDQLIQSKDLDARSDVWALGVILFELLSQRCPFEGEDAPQLIAHILHTAPPWLSSIRGDVPAELSALVQAALVKDRTQRIPNVAEFARRLAPFAPEQAHYSLQVITGALARQSGGVAPAQGTGSWGASSGAGVARPGHTAAGPSAAAAPATTQSAAALTLPPRSTGGRVALLATAGVALIIALASVFLFSKGPAPPASATAAGSTGVTEPNALPAPPSVVSAPETAELAPSVPAPVVAPSDSVARPSDSIVPPHPAKAVLTKPAQKSATSGAAGPNRPAAPVHATDPFGGVR